MPRWAEISAKSFSGPRRPERGGQPGPLLGGSAAGPHRGQAVRKAALVFSEISVSRGLFSLKCKVVLAKEPAVLRLESLDLCGEA